MTKAKSKYHAYVLLLLAAYAYFFFLEKRRDFLFYLTVAILALAPLANNWIREKSLKNPGANQAENESRVKRIIRFLTAYSLNPHDKIIPNWLFFLILAFLARALSYR